MYGNYRTIGKFYYIRPVNEKTGRIIIIPDFDAKEHKQGFHKNLFEIMALNREAAIVLGKYAKFNFPLTQRFIPIDSFDHFQSYCANFGTFTFLIRPAENED